MRPLTMRFPVRIESDRVAGRTSVRQIYLGDATGISDLRWRQRTSP